MKKFEHKVIGFVIREITYDFLNDLFNKFGEEGWELVTGNFKDERTVDYYFKREIIVLDAKPRRPAPWNKGTKTVKGEDEKQEEPGELLYR